MLNASLNLSCQWARLESNQHALAGTRPSTLRVCQFRHEPKAKTFGVIRTAGQGSLPATASLFNLQNLIGCVGALADCEGFCGSAGLGASPCFSGGAIFTFG